MDKTKLNSLLKTNDKYHYNFVQGKDYSVSMGSLRMDIHTGGGLKCGIHRLGGPSESGKTSAALEIMKNFLATVEKPRGIYIKAEGRLSENMIKRSGVKFVDSIDEWEEGTCFILKTNVYDFVIKFMMELINNNPDSITYCFIIDCMDALGLEENFDKDITDNFKVAGAPLITKKFFSRMSLPISSYGHMVLPISQVSAQIKISQYDGQPIRKESGTGGNALKHYPNWFFDFQDRYGADLILENPAAKPDPEKNKIIGHWAKGVIRKSDNEQSENKFRYPIIYGKEGGNSIWWQKEVLEILIEWGLMVKKGAWFNLDQYAVDLLITRGICNEEVASQKIQGMENAFKFLEENPLIAKFFRQYIIDNCNTPYNDPSAS